MLCQIAARILRINTDRCSLAVLLLAEDAASLLLLKLRQPGRGILTEGAMMETLLRVRASKTVSLIMIRVTLLVRLLIELRGGHHDRTVQLCWPGLFELRSDLRHFSRLIRYDNGQVVVGDYARVRH